MDIKNEFHISGSCDKYLLMHKGDVCGSIELIVDHLEVIFYEAKHIIPITQDIKCLQFDTFIDTYCNYTTKVYKKSLCALLIYPTKRHDAYDGNIYVITYQQNEMFVVPNVIGKKLMLVFQDCGNNLFYSDDGEKYAQNFDFHDVSAITNIRNLPYEYYWEGTHDERVKSVMLPLVRCTPGIKLIDKLSDITIIAD